MAASNVLLNVITLGGHARLNKATSQYKDSYVQYQALHQTASVLRQNMEREARIVEEITAGSFAVIRKARRLLRLGKLNLVAPPHQPPVDLQAFDSRRKVAAVPTKYSSAISVTKGLGTGSAVTAGSWALASHIGTASTGVHISELSGLAAARATLAWFGGGAVAAGGAGMAGGAAVLGGVLTAPLVIYSTWSSHSKASKIGVKARDMEVVVGDVRSRIASLETALSLVTAQTTQLTKAYDAVELDYQRARRALFPFGPASVLWRHLRRLLGFSFYSRRDSKRVDDLVHSLEQFSALFPLAPRSALAATM